MLLEERLDVESCLQPRLHVKLFQIDEYVEPINSNHQEISQQAQRAIKRTRNATTMIERFSRVTEIGSDTMTELFPLTELSDDSLQKFSDVTSNTNQESSSKPSIHPNQRIDIPDRKRIEIRSLQSLHKTIRIAGKKRKF